MLKHTTLRENKYTHKYSLFAHTVLVPPSSVCATQNEKPTHTPAHTSSGHKHAILDIPLALTSAPPTLSMLSLSVYMETKMIITGVFLLKSCSLLHATSLKESITYSNASPHLCPDPFSITEGWTVTQTAATRQAGAGHRHHGPG